MDCSGSSSSREGKTRRQSRFFHQRSLHTKYLHMSKYVSTVMLVLFCLGCGQDAINQAQNNSQSNTSNTEESTQGSRSRLDDHGVTTTSGAGSEEQNNTSFFGDDEDLEGKHVDPWCGPRYNCGSFETCLSGECEPSCFKSTSCADGDTCRWEDGEAVCLEPWSCELGGSGSISSESAGSCKVTFSCVGDGPNNFVFECTGSDGKCYCIQNDKIVGEIQRPSENVPYLICSWSPEAISTINTACGWAILPKK